MDHKKERLLNLSLSIPTVVSLIIIALIPVIFPIMSKYEGEWFPVLRRVEIIEVNEELEATYVKLRFNKVRSCEFVGLSWYDRFGDRAPIVFETEDYGEGKGEIPTTRPVREGQTVGPWRLIGIDRLEGTVAIIAHKCHPLWITYSRFWP